MPDVTLCEGRDCPFKDNCYRYKAEPSKYRQSYFLEVPYKDGKCEYYSPIEKVPLLASGSEAGSPTPGAQVCF